MAVRIYAPMGQTLVLRVQLTRNHLSSIGAITPDERLFMQMQDRAHKAEDAVLSLHRISGKLLLLIWDGSQIHRVKEIKDFLK